MAATSDAVMVAKRVTRRRWSRDVRPSSDTRVMVKSLSPYASVSGKLTLGPVGAPVSTLVPFTFRSEYNPYVL